MEKRIKPYRAWLSIIGGGLGILLTPIMVTIKYMTGWDIIPQPFWVEGLQNIGSPLFSFAPPTELWSLYGSLYSVTLSLMISGFLLLWPKVRESSSRWLKAGFWMCLAGLLMVLLGDFIHSITWHRSGITIPTPFSDPLPNTAFAIGMMGMNFILIGSLIFGISGLGGNHLPKWLAWLFILITPSAPLFSTTLLPTTPSGGLVLFALISILLGQYFLELPKRIIS